jgi:hypothetical protein
MMILILMIIISLFGIQILQSVLLAASEGVCFVGGQGHAASP